MSDEEISKAPAQDITSTDTDADNTSNEDNNPRVFDITPDLNIAPAKDDMYPSSNTDNSNQTPISINILDKQVNVQSTTEPNITPEPTIQEPQKTASSFGPANPPAKTVGMNKINPNKSFEQINSTEPTNLQDAVASIKINPEKPSIKNVGISSNKIPEKPWLPKKDSAIKPLRTYETDFAEAMAKKRITTTSAIIAENKKQEEQPIQISNKDIIGDIPVPPYKNNQENRTPFLVQNQTAKLEQQKENREESANRFIKKDILRNVRPPTTPKNPDQSKILKNSLLIIISVILIGGGIYAGYYLYKISPLAKMLTKSPVDKVIEPTIFNSQSLFQVDSKVNIAIDNKNENQILSLIKTELSKDGEQGKIKEITLTKTLDNITKKVTADELLKIIKLPVPELITRAIAPEWMLGIFYGIGGQKSVFVISTNTFFQNTFAGMIQWENSMPQDLKIYTTDYNDANFTLKGQYKDKIIKNKDVREYVLENGHINYLYSFVSNDKLVVTNNEETLNEVIMRLEKNAFVR
jgi:hypothetical protein